MVTILRRNVPVVCGASCHLLGYRILQDSKIWFRLQVESYISDWVFSKSWLLASYVSRHKAMAYDTQKPISTHSTTKCVVKILDAKYEKIDLPAIIRKNCSHLQASDREKLLSMLLKFESLFNGTLGDWNLPPVSFKLKEGMKPYRWFRYTLLVPTSSLGTLFEPKTFGMHINFYRVYLGCWYKILVCFTSGF